MKNFCLLSLALLLSVEGFALQFHGVDYEEMRSNTNVLPLEYRRSTMIVRFGPKIGINLSDMSNRMSFDPSFSMGTGVQIGGVANFHWGQRTTSSMPGTGVWGLQTELLYSRHIIGSNGGNLGLNYMRFPVMLKIYPLSRFSVEVGPEFSYLMMTSPGSIAIKGTIVNVGECHGFDFGTGLGVAYEFDFGLVVGTRYSMGFADLGKNLKWKHSSNVQITAGWLF